MKHRVPNISQVWQAGFVPDVVMRGGRPATLLLTLDTLEDVDDDVMSCLNNDPFISSRVACRRSSSELGQLLCSWCSQFADDDKPKSLYWTVDCWGNQGSDSVAWSWNMTNNKISLIHTFAQILYIPDQFLTSISQLHSTNWRWNILQACSSSWSLSRSLLIRIQPPLQIQLQTPLQGAGLDSRIVSL